MVAFSERERAQPQVGTVLHSLLTVFGRMDLQLKNSLNFKTIIALSRKQVLCLFTSKCGEQLDKFNSIILQKKQGKVEVFYGGRQKLI